MIASSIWSLIMPALENAKSPFIVAFGFLAGICFFLLCDEFCSRSMHLDSLGAKGKMMLAVTIHNLPEGMAVGVAFAGALMGSSLSLGEAFLIAVGISLQNFPEGAILSMPLFHEKHTRKKAFYLGSLSGVVEPIGAVAAFFLTRFVAPVLPFILSFAAGAMIYVVADELIPSLKSGEKKEAGLFWLGLGFCTMMLMDVILG
jgi:ZIP family zinc transporter